MKKLLSILLSVAMSLTAMASLSFAETSETVQEATEYTFPHWTLIAASRVQRVYNADTDKAGKLRLLMEIILIGHIFFSTTFRRISLFQIILMKFHVI